MPTGTTVVVSLKQLQHVYIFYNIYKVAATVIQSSFVQYIIIYRSMTIQ